jgi:hypothetical protein
MRTVDLLRHLADDLGARGVRQSRQLLEVLLERVPGAGPLPGRPDEQGALDRGL